MQGCFILPASSITCACDHTSTLWGRAGWGRNLWSQRGIGLATTPHPNPLPQLIITHIFSDTFHISRPGLILWREKGTLLISTVREGKDPQGHACKRLMQAA